MHTHTTSVLFCADVVSLCKFLSYFRLDVGISAFFCLPRRGARAQTLSIHYSLLLPMKMWIDMSVNTKRQEKRERGRRDRKTIRFTCIPFSAEKSYFTYTHTYYVHICKACVYVCAHMLLLLFHFSLSRMNLKLKKAISRQFTGEDSPLPCPHCVCVVPLLSFGTIIKCLKVGANQANLPPPPALPGTTSFLFQTSVHMCFGHIIAWCCPVVMCSLRNVCLWHVSRAKVPQMQSA